MVQFDATDQIVDVRVLNRARVLQIKSGKDEKDLAIKFSEANGIYRLASDVKNFGEVYDRLVEAEESESLVVFSAAVDGLEIDDVELARDDSGRTSLFRDWPSLFAPFWLMTWGNVSRLSETGAKCAFERLEKLASDPLRPTNKSIPFLFPDNGCEARAHAICREFVEASPKIIPGKIWLFGGTLGATSRNYPYSLKFCLDPPCQCLVPWAYHVAPYTWSSQRPGEKIVFDPSLFSYPVSSDEWLRKLGAENGQVVVTSHKVFGFKDGRPNGRKFGDLRCAKTEEQLMRHRVELCVRAHVLGPPPYQACSQ